MNDHTQKQYDRARAQGAPVHHGAYCLYNAGAVIAYDGGAIRLVELDMPEDSDFANVTVHYASGESVRWRSKRITAYVQQFGVAVSPDGQRLFAQNWNSGLYCLDARTGEELWRTKRRRGVTSLFVGDGWLLCHRHGDALELLDMGSGEALAQKRPASGWGFTAIDGRRIVCRVSARRWEIIEARTLQTLQAFSHREFTGGHEDYSIRSIALDGAGHLKVCGFDNVWDTKTDPPVMLPNPEFEHRLAIREQEETE